MLHTHEAHVCENTAHTIGQEGAVIMEAQWAPKQALPFSLQTDSSWPWVRVLPATGSCGDHGFW